MSEEREISGTTEVLATLLSIRYRRLVKLLLLTIKGQSSVAFAKMRRPAFS